MRYNYTKIAYLKFYVFINVLLFFCSAIPVLADNFIKTVLVYYVTSINVAEIPKLAKYDVLVLNRFNYDDVNQQTWQIIKQANPAIKIFIYQLGPQTSDNQDNFKTVYLNSISRYKNARNHSMGVITDDFFLKDSTGKRINNPAYPKYWLLDFGNTAFQKYWAESTETDIITMPWKADGIMIDNCMAANARYLTNPIGGGNIPIKYPNAASWNNAMNNFVAAVVSYLHNSGIKVFTNRCNSRDEAGYDAWRALDISSGAPDIIMEEGAFAVQWGYGDVQFYGEKEWKRQIDLGQQIKNSKIAYLSHTDLTPDGSGIDNFGKQVTYWQILWYSMCSYHLAKNEKNMPFFMFVNNPYKQIAWFTEYEKIDLGAPSGNYKITSSAEANIYWREFEKGYVYVNPSLKDAVNINLPVPCVQLTHENLDSNPKSLPVIQKINIPSHHGVIVMKASALSIPLSTPQNVRFVN